MSMDHHSQLNRERNGSAHEGSRFEILLVEDQAKHQLIYKESLTSALPVEVTCATSGKSALARIGVDPPPDLLILDLEIPDIRGEEILRHLREDHRLRQIPVIILTGLSSTAKQLELLDQGADDFIEKGASPDIIIARVKAQMRHKLALDRFTRMALDRDLFAAGVLKDISSIRSSVMTLCGQARSILQADPVAQKNELLACFQKLSSQATRLGAYAADVIQSVRESRRTPKLEQLEIKSLLDWVLEVLVPADATAQQRITCSFVGTLAPVIADKSFLRLALINILQHAQKQADASGSAIEISQQAVTGDFHQPTVGTAPIARSLLRTSIRDHGKSHRSGSLATLFQPFVRDDDHGSTSDSNDMGFGLGLSLAAKVIAMMGGRIGADKPPAGSGTIIWFELPAAGK